MGFERPLAELAAHSSGGGFDQTLALLVEWGNGAADQPAAAPPAALNKKSVLLASKSLATGAIGRPHVCPWFPCLSPALLLRVDLGVD